MSVIDRYDSELTEFETLFESIVDKSISHSEAVCANLAQERSESTDSFVRSQENFINIETMSANNRSCVGNLMENVDPLHKDVKNLINRRNVLTEKYSELESTFKQLSKKLNQKEKEYQEINLLAKTYRAVTGIDFTSSTNVNGFIFNKEKHILKPFSLQTKEGVKQEEELWEMLGSVFS